MPILGNSFTVLNRGKSLGTYEKKDISREKLLSMMAGGEELNKFCLLYTSPSPRDNR